MAFPAFPGLIPPTPLPANDLWCPIIPRSISHFHSFTFPRIPPPISTFVIFGRVRSSLIALSFCLASVVFSVVRFRQSSASFYFLLVPRSTRFFTGIPYRFRQLHHPSPLRIQPPRRHKQQYFLRASITNPPLNLIPL